MSFFTPNPQLFGVRVAKYIRCSHDDQVLHGDTLEAQDMILNDFVSTNKMVLVDTFVDEAFTARKKFNKRKEFIRLLDGVKAHNFELIIFTKLDRWFRNIGDYHKIQEILEANGVQWKAVTENYDTTTTNGRLHINIRLSVAQDECDRDSDRIKDVFAYKLKNKTYVSGSLPRGLKLDAEKHVIIDPEWNGFALDMFDYFEATCSKRATAHYLQNKYNIRVCYDSLVRNLRNPLYKGQYRDDIDFCPQTISPERFDHIQILANKNLRERRTRRHFIFSGLLICSDCKHYLVGTANYYDLADGSHVCYKSYRCNYHTESKLCDRSKTYREEIVEEYMLNHIRPALADHIAKYDITTTAVIKQNPANEIDKIERKMKKLYDLFMDDLIDKESYRAEYENFKKQIDELQKQPAPPIHNVDNIRRLLSEDWESVYRGFSDQEKNVFWKSFIDHAVVYEDGSMDIFFL